MAQQQNPLNLSGETYPKSGRQSQANALDRQTVRLLLSLIGNPPITFELWGDQEKIHPANCDPRQAVANVVIHDRKTLFNLILSPDIGFGDAFSTGRLEIEGDLGTFLETTYWSRRGLSGLPLLAHKLAESLPKKRGSSFREAKNNIQHHYDIGNDFYRLWLDEEMVYTCAYFDEPDITLEQAQARKMDHICRKLRLRDGLNVVEAGCGWGALARHMAKNYDVRVRAFNISKEQIEYARWKAKTLGLEKKIEYVEEDYRNISGQYDAFVSVGMLEHVGVNYYRDLGGVIHRSLKPNGFGLIHSIGRNKPKPNSPWTEKRIFPGSCPPSLSQMMEIFEPYNLSVLDIENLRLHYARTLEHWTERFESHIEEIADNYDQEFINAWRLYLIASTTAFKTGSLQLFQVLFSPDSNNELPLTRQHLYQ